LSRDPGGLRPNSAQAVVRIGQTSSTC